MLITQLKSLIIVLASIHLTACGVLYHKEKGHPPADASPPGKVDDPNGTPLAPQPSIDDITFEYKSIVREIPRLNGQPDRAMLLIVRPSRGDLKITNVWTDVRDFSRPDDKFYNDTIDEISKKVKIFGQSQLPMIDSDRDQLVETHKGASAFYVENYSPAICDGDPDYKKKFGLDGTLEGKPIYFQFSFGGGVPAVDGSCLFQSESFMSTNTPNVVSH